MSSVEVIKEWMRSNTSPTMVPSLEEPMIERFLHVCNNDLKRTKEVMQLFFQLRREYEDFFTDRDPMTKSQCEIFDTVYVYPLPKKTAEGYQVYITHLTDPNPDNFLMDQYVKMFFNISDVRMKLEDKIPTGDIPVFDMNGFTLKHLMKLMFSLSLVKKYMKMTQEAHPVKLVQIHVINASSMLERVLTLLRPLMKDEVRDMMHIHLEGSNTFFEYISQDIIPVDLGGKGTPLKEISDYWKRQLEYHRSWLLTNPWRNNDSKQRSKETHAYRTVEFD